MHKFERLSEEQAKAAMPQLAVLLRESVHSGASFGFIPPLGSDTAEEYWLVTLKEVAQGKRIVLVSTAAEDVTGSVQLSLVTNESGLHRAEV
jgi:hypothetical protein